MTLNVLSPNQHTPLDINGNIMNIKSREVYHPNIPRIMPDQKPRQRLHLNNSLNQLSLHNILRIGFNILPYFNIHVSPKQAII